MILSMMIAAVAVSQPSAGREMPEVQVHEWGVITFEAFMANAQAAPDSVPPAVPDYPMVERAPVVYFHGPEFTGSFTVAATDGVITDLYPVAAGAPAGASYTWQIEGLLSWPEDRDARRGLSYGARNWDMEGWRIPYSLWLRTADGFEDGFLYYEATVNRTSAFPVRYMQSLGEAISAHPDLPAALIVPGMDGPRVVSAARLELLPGLATLRQARICSSPDDLLRVLYDWSIDTVDIDEVNALWATWRGWLFGEGIDGLPDGCGLFLYPLPADLQDEISTIDLTTDQGYQVGYRRFLICAVPVSL